LKFKIQNGMGLILRGRLGVYDQRGEYQLIVEYAEPKGIGALQLAFIQLKERLAKEGLFDESRKKALPMLPNCIGIVTSATGAAIHDMLKVLKRRYVNLEVLICPVRVQGEGASAEIAAAIRDLNSYRKVDIIIVGRGGGSLEDLWPFNEEVVARAIYDSRIPVVSAVGHEIDFTIADFVADLRAPTPSAAAELVVKNKSELTAEVDNLSRRLEFAVRQNIRQLWSGVEGLSRSVKDPSMFLGYLVQRVDDLYERLNRSLKVQVTQRRERLASLANHLRLTSPQVEMERSRERLLKLSARFETSTRKMLDENHEATAVLAARLQALSPLATLARGFAVARKLPDGPVIRESSQIVPGDRLDVTFHRGSAVCVVESGSENS
ncbi:MAG: Exodeoxyribonuclease large subunit, partial [Geobacteraceae bacterium]|nr:Exodeoxyribonuclease large subunit [Geobacteraceae bacterium]